MQKKSLKALRCLLEAGEESSIFDVREFPHVNEAIWDGLVLDAQERGWEITGPRSIALSGYWQIWVGGDFFEIPTTNPLDALIQGIEQKYRKEQKKKNFD